MASSFNTTSDRRLPSGKVNRISGGRPLRERWCRRNDDTRSRTRGRRSVVWSTWLVSKPGEALGLPCSPMRAMTFPKSSNSNQGAVLYPPLLYQDANFSNVYSFFLVFPVDRRKWPSVHFAPFSMAACIVWRFSAVTGRCERNFSTGRNRDIPTSIVKYDCRYRNSWSSVKYPRLASSKSSKPAASFVLLFPAHKKENPTANSFKLTSPWCRPYLPFSNQAKKSSNDLSNDACSSGFNCKYA